MAEYVPIGDAGDAARLIAFGMRPRLLPTRDLAYLELVKRYGEDETFRDLVEAVAAGLGLAVLAVEVRTGAVLAAMTGSLFEVRIDEYARRAAFRERRDVEKTLHGLIHLAVAALAFPRPDDLANDAYVGRVSVEQVDGVVREASRLLEERAVAAEANNDPLDDAPELERTWRVYARRAAAGVSRSGSLARDATRSMITKAMKFLAEHGFLVARGDEGGGTFATTPRYQVQVRELAAEGAFAELLALGVVAVTDPTGTLHVLGDTL
ncbi:MAG: hypothetical protein JXA67_09715 [Micromonosporaceae bacterium]|nr:hypothetical protein [Micromonosporaceae bacterium]